MGITYADPGGAGLTPEQVEKLNRTDKILDLSQPAAVFNGLLRFDVPKRLEYTGPGRCVLALDKTTPPVPGTTIVVQVRSATNLSAPLVFGNTPGDEEQDIDCPSEWDFAGSGGDLDIIITATSIASFVSTAKSVLPADSTPPTIESATVDGDALDELILEFSDRMKCPDVAGLSVTSPSRGVSSLISGDGTKILTFQLSSELEEGDEPNLVVAANRTLRELNGSLLGTGTTAITVEGGAGHTTASLPNRTLHLRGDQGNAAADGGAVATWTSVAPGALAWEETTNRPVRNNDGISGDLVSVDFDGTNKRLACEAATISALTGGDAGYYVCGVVRINAASAIGTGYNVAHAIIADEAGWWGVFFWLNGGSIQVIAYHYDSTARYAVGGTISAGTDIHFAVRQDGTNGLRLYVNGTLVQTTAGATGAIDAAGQTASTRLAQNSANVFGNLRIHELCVCSADPGDTLHNAQMAYYAELLA